MSVYSRAVETPLNFDDAKEACEQMSAEGVFNTCFLLEQGNAGYPLIIEVK